MKLIKINSKTKTLCYFAFLEIAVLYLELLLADVINIGNIILKIQKPFFFFKNPRS